MLNKFTLTLLSTIVLTACGSSGGSSNTPQEKHLPSNNTSKTHDVTTNPTATDTSRQPEGEKSALMPSHKEVQADETKPRPSLKSEQKSEQPKAEQPKAEQPKAEQPKAEQPKAEQPEAEQPKAEQPKAEQPKAEQPKAEQPKAEQPKAEQPKAEQPKAEQPEAEQPKAKTSEELNNKIDNPLTNTAIFDSFNRDGGKFTSSKKWISLKFDDENKNIQVMPLYEKMAFSEDQEVKALLDNSGRLLGYFGYTSFSHIEPNINNPGEESVTHYSLPILEMDKTQMIRPNNDLRYEGSFYYVYDNRAVTALTGRVSGNYSDKEKRLFLNLIGQNNEFWELKENYRQNGVKVAENGEIFGRIYDNKTPNATFDGGIYGKHGEVLTGTLEYEDHTTEKNSWKGVLEAKAQ